MQRVLKINGVIDFVRGRCLQAMAGLSSQRRSGSADWDSAHKLHVSKEIKMKMRIYALLLAIFTSTSALAVVDEVTVGYKPRTGDAYIDAQLGDVNVFARGDTDGFIDEIVVSFGAPRYLVRELIVDRRWPPGDVYYACALAYQLKKPCGYVSDIYQKDHGQGWGVIAKRLGIKPGSPEFHAMKKNINGGYMRMDGKAKNKAATQNAAMKVGPEQGKGQGKDKGKGKNKGG
jgi:hypothetical protein